MKVGIAQFDGQLGDVAANMSRITSWMHRAKQKCCDLVIFPEMVDTGYEMQTILDKASAWDDGPCHEVRRLAAEIDINVICGLSERVGDRVYNAAAMIASNGELLGKYRKAHLFSLAGVCEDQYLARGDAMSVVNLQSFELGTMICYDLRFPELARSMALRGATVLVVIAAWPHARIDNWNTLTEARAIENQAYVLAANRVGCDADLVFGGSSRIIDPRGSVLTLGTTEGEALLVADLSARHIEQTRNAMPIFRDRQPDLYRL